jgi:hypothetical protein
VLCIKAWYEQELPGFRIQVIVQVKALEETLTHIVRQGSLFEGRLDKIDCPFSGVEDNATILTAFQMFFDLLAQLGA